VLAKITQAATARFTTMGKRLADELDSAAAGREAAEMRAAAAQLREAVAEATLHYEERACEPYADDFCATAPPVVLAMLDFIMEMEGREAGLPWAPDKDVYGPDITILGAAVSAPTQRMSLPVRRAQAYAIVLQEFVEQYDNNTRIPWERLASIRGKLGFAAGLGRWLRWALASMDDAMYARNSGAEWAVTAPEWAYPSARMWEELREFWLPLLRAAPHRLLSRSSWSVLPRALATGHATGRSGSDASTSVGVGGAVGTSIVQRPLRQREQRARGATTGPQLAPTIQVLEGRTAWEVLAHRLGIRLSRTGADSWRLSMTHGAGPQRWFLEIDNSGAVSDWNKGGQQWSAGRALRGELFLAILADIAFDVELRAYHLPGTAIIALGHDDASRQMRSDSVPLVPAAFPESAPDEWHARELWRAVCACHAYRSARPDPRNPEVVIDMTSGEARHPGPYAESEPSSDEEHAGPLTFWRTHATRTAGGSPSESSDSDDQPTPGRNLELDQAVSDLYDDTWAKLRTLGTHADLVDTDVDTSSDDGELPATVPGEALAVRSALRRRRRPRRRPGACSVHECQHSSVPPALVCSRCARTLHWECAGVQGRSESPAGWWCGVCLTDGDEQLAGALGMDNAAALVAASSAPGTDKTVADGVERFLAVVQATAASRGTTVTREEVLPPAPAAETPLHFVLSFVVAASGALPGAQVYAYSTITTTLSSLTAWHKIKSGARVHGPSNALPVKQALKSVRKAAARRGTLAPRRSYPCPLEILEILAEFVAHASVQLRASGAAWFIRYTVLRNYAYCELMFLAVLRTNEGISARFGAQSIRDKLDNIDMFEFLVPPAKNHQTESIWVAFPAVGPGRISFRRTLRLLVELLVERGVTPDADTPVFGWSHEPGRQLSSARAIFGAETFLRAWIHPALRAAGREDLVEMTWTGYSFRRGGINAVYTAARANGVAGLELLALLLKTGRWQSVSSLAVYLVDLDRELAALLKLMCSRGGRLAATVLADAGIAAVEPPSLAPQRVSGTNCEHTPHTGRIGELWARHTRVSHMAQERGPPPGPPHILRHGHAPAG
jgi:hypothetical protein